jgi:hypothetical protein
MDRHARGDRRARARLTRRLRLSGGEVAQTKPDAIDSAAR